MSPVTVFIVFMELKKRPFVPIQAAINAAGTNAVINIPGGNYLLIPPQQLGSPFTAWYMSALVITNGGITFSGAGASKTTLTGCGAWQIFVNGITGRNDGETYRGFLFVVPSISNTNPVVFENLTMDGGVQHGFYGSREQPANTVNGQGWDETHDAFIDATGTPRINYMALINCQFQHWRGEMLKSVGSATNGFLLITNCVFNDGQATALNIYPQQLVEDCVFTNLFEVEEYYQLYNICGPSFFINNQIQYCRGIAINGGADFNSAYVISNNTFNLVGQIALLTAPGDNVYFQNNEVLDTGYGGYGAMLGVTGFQPGTSQLGFFGNSILFGSVEEIFTRTLRQFLVAGDAYGNAVQDVTVSNNVLLNPSLSVSFGQQYNSSYCTNIVFVKNSGGKLSSCAANSLWFIDAGSNSFNPFSAFYVGHTFQLF